MNSHADEKANRRDIYNKRMFTLNCQEINETTKKTGMYNENIYSEYHETKQRVFTADYQKTNETPKKRENLLLSIK